jgi:hypothetical protein
MQKKKKKKERPEVLEEDSEQHQQQHLHPHMIVKLMIVKCNGAAASACAEPLSSEYG